MTKVFVDQPLALPVSANYLISTLFQFYSVISYQTPDLQETSSSTMEWETWRRSIFVLLFRMVVRLVGRLVGQLVVSLLGMSKFCHLFSWDMQLFKCLMTDER